MLGGGGAPRSPILQLQLVDTKIAEGTRSPWSMLCWCKYNTAFAISKAMLAITSLGG